MGNNVSASIQVTNNSGGPYTAGGTIKGTIQVQVKKAIPRNDAAIVVVSLSGEEKTYIPPPPAEEKKHRFTTDMKVLLYDQRFQVPITNQVGSNVVQPGEYNLPFECRIPATAPTSSSTDKEFANYNCRVRNILRVFVDNEKNGIAKEEVTVINPLPLSSVQPPSPPKVIRPYKAGGGNGNISVGFVLDKTSSIVEPGGKLSLLAVIRNRSTTQIHKLKIKVIEQTMYKTEPPPNLKQRGANYLTDQTQ